MTTPNEPTELDKAIEIAIKYVNDNDDIPPFTDIQLCLVINAAKRLKEVEKERDEVKKGHCKDCCCAQSWKALGITQYTGKSIPEHITDLRNQLIFECDSSGRLSQLRTAYKEALEVIKSIGEQLECPSRNTTMSSYRRDGSVIISSDIRTKVKELLTNPLAIEVMKEKKV